MVSGKYLPKSPLKVPGGHGSHCVCPAKRVYHPTGHGSHFVIPFRNCALPGAHGSHKHEFQLISFPPLLRFVFGSHTAHLEPLQHPFPLPPPAKQPSSEKNTASGFSAWYTMKIAELFCGTQSCACVGVGNDDARHRTNNNEVNQRFRDDVGREFLVCRREHPPRHNDSHPSASSLRGMPRPPARSARLARAMRSGRDAFVAEEETLFVSLDQSQNEQVGVF